MYTVLKATLNSFVHSSQVSNSLVLIKKLKLRLNFQFNPTHGLGHYFDLGRKLDIVGKYIITIIIIVVINNNHNNNNNNKNKKYCKNKKEFKCTEKNTKR